MFLSGPESGVLVALLAVPLLILVAVLVWVLRLQARVRRLEAHRPAGEADIAELKGEIARALRHVAVVRYDAFGDMGGRLSFSAALIDDSGDGVVISSIHARGESRTYAKGIVAGKSDTTLTPEEQQALAAARSGKASA
ncbi:MAG TPA: DUF4446 family protein [Intrasporangiaceae bacterium]|nr:DUF4446 family protein [Intrasporangiaceae bacterium]